MNVLTRSMVGLLFAAGLSTAVLFADGPKHSPAHEAAVRKCTADYEAAAAAAHAPNGPKGNARKHAMHAAAEAKKACIARAPK